MQSPPQEQVEVRFMIHFTNIFIKPQTKKKKKNEKEEAKIEIGCILIG